MMKHLFLSAVVALFTAGLPADNSFAETATIRVAQQFGISYLPLIVAKERKLIEEAITRAGLPEPKVEWLTINGAAGMNEALISGNLDVASGSISAIITAWAKTRNTANIMGLASLCSMPIVLTANNPNIKTIADFTDKDRIALPAIRISIQSQILQMAADTQLGKFDKLEGLTISMAHPDATIAMLSGRSEITANFSAPPFAQQQMKDPRIHAVLNSYDVLKGSHTFNGLYATGKFVNENPKTAAAFVDALDASDAWIKANPAEAAKLYIAAEKSKLDPAFVEAIITDPQNRFTTVPEKVEVFAEFQFRVGTIKIKPASWRDIFQPALREREGS